MTTIYQKKSYIIPVPTCEPGADTIQTLINTLTELGNVTTQGAVIVSTDNPAMFPLLEWLQNKPTQNDQEKGENLNV